MCPCAEYAADNIGWLRAAAPSPALDMWLGILDGWLEAHAPGIAVPVWPARDGEAEEQLAIAVLEPMGMLQKAAA